jgi:transcriptional regulator GlxA family with amidase domain
MALDAERIKKVLEERLAEVRTIADLARILTVAPRTLKRLFDDHEGTTLAKYIAQLRVDRAKGLLLNSDLECKEISYLLGFSSQNVGAHVFKRLTGYNMQRYRVCFKPELRRKPHH